MLSGACRITLSIHVFHVLVLSRSHDGASHHLRDSQTQDQPLSGPGRASDGAGAAVHSRYC